MGELRNIIRRLLSRADLNKNVIVRHSLANGLQLAIVIKREDPANIYLQLRRPSVWPSETELDTVLKHWPHLTKQTGGIDRKTSNNGQIKALQITLLAGVRVD